MNNKILLAAFSLIALIAVIWFTRSTQPKLLPPSSPAPTVSTKDQKVEHQAGFAIFTNGVFRVFSAAMYHNLSKDVFIESNNPNIIQVKKVGITWNDFFKTLPFKLTKDCLTTGTKETFCTTDKAQLKFYLNGVKTENLLDLEIKDGDRALITFGGETEVQIQNQLQKVPKP